MLNDPVDPACPESDRTTLIWFHLRPDPVRHRTGRWHARGLLPPTEHTVFASCGMAAPMALVVDWADDQTAMDEGGRCGICAVARLFRGERALPPDADHGAGRRRAAPSETPNIRPTTTIIR